MDQSRYINRTLDHRVVGDTIAALFSTDTSRKAITGGMAVQHYLPLDYRRPTTDVDVTLDSVFGSSEFRHMSVAMNGYLVPKGYKLSPKKRRESFDIDVEDSDQGILTVQFSKRNCNNYRTWRERLAEEVDHSRTFPHDETSYLVVAPENLITRKLVRASTFVDRYGVSLSNKGGTLGGQLERLARAKEDYFRRIDQVTPEDLADLRLAADVYDLSALNSFCDLDPDYFVHTSRHWNALRGNPVVEQMKEEFLSKLRRSS